MPTTSPASRSSRIRDWCAVLLSGRRHARAVDFAHAHDAAGDLRRGAGRVRPHRNLLSPTSTTVSSRISWVVGKATLVRLSAERGCSGGASFLDLDPSVKQHARRASAGVRGRRSRRWKSSATSGSLPAPSSAARVLEAECAAWQADIRNGSRDCRSRGGRGGVLLQAGHPRSSTSSCRTDHRAVDAEGADVDPDELG